MPLSVGLVGFGMVAERFHAPLITVEPGLRLTHVVERHANRSQQLYPEVTVLRSLRELLATEVEVVVVLTPNPSHYELARQALEAGKHVVVDKPFTVTSAEADQLVETARTHHRVLGVFHNRRWDGDFLTVQKLLDEGSLGRLVEFESHFDRFRPELKGVWREQDQPGSGVLYDLGSHLLDQALVLFGPPEWVWADLRAQRGGPAVDHFELVCGYADLKVTLKSSCLTCLAGPSFLLHGDHGSYIKLGLDPQEEALKAGQLPRGNDWGKEPCSAWGRLVTPDGERLVETLPGDYPAFYRDFVAAVRGGRQPAVTGAQAARVIRGLELATLSHQERRAVPWG